MDLASEMETSVPRETWKPKFDNLTQNAGEFCQFLLGCCSKLDSGSFTNATCETFLDEFSAVALPPGVTTPFSVFTGQEEKHTVIFSKRHHDMGVPYSEDTQNASLSFASETSEFPTPETSLQSMPVCPFSVTRIKTVNIGQPLSNKKVFLTKSKALHNGQAAGFSTNELICIPGIDVSPISLDKARYLCSLYALGARKAARPLPAIWVICQSQGIKTVALGCSYDVSILHTYTIVEEERLQILQSPVSKSDLEKLTSTKLGKSNSWAFSEYEISSTIGDDKGKYAQLMLQFAWSEPESLLCPPPENSDAVLRIAATPGSMFSPVLLVYQELSSLLTLCKIACNQAQWPSEEDSVENSQLVDRVHVFLEDVASPLAQPLEVNVISPTVDHTVYEPRKHLDFAERLWMFVREVQSLEDLQQVFSAVFKAVLLGKVQPFLHKSGSSPLSYLLRQVLLCPSNEERQALATKFQVLLTEPKVLTCLVQIGIEKMQRDYRSFFIGSDLANGTQLDHFFANPDSLLEQCHSLCKLHNVLELNATALSYLNLPTSTLSSLTKIALEVYKDETFEELGATTSVFCLPLPAYSTSLKSVASLCSNLSPKTWILSAQDNQSVFRSQPLFPNSETIEPADIEGTALEYIVYKGCCISMLAS